MIKVLWIDDQEFEQLENIAEDYDVDLIHVYSWLEAEKKLKGSQFDEWDAIIFDCYCTMVPGGNEDEHFLRKAFSRFHKICGENRIIPWYIFSQGTGDRFENIIDNQLEEDRLEWDSEWEKVYYSKTTDYKQLLANINAMAPKRHNYDVRHRYIDFFNAVENTERYGNIKEMIFPVLKAIHYPNDSDSFNAVDYYNKLRKVVEQIFYSCNRMGFLPKEFIPEGHGVNLCWSNNYLSGKIAKDLFMRFGNVGEMFFPPVIADAIDKILNIANINSHSANLRDDENLRIKEYFSNIAGDYVVYGMAMSIVSIILWYEEYLESGHKDVEKNKKTCQTILDTGIIENHNGIYHVGEICVSSKDIQSHLGNSVRLKSIIWNTSTKTNKKYPYFSNSYELLEEVSNGSKTQGTNQKENNLVQENNT